MDTEGNNHSIVDWIHLAPSGVHLRAFMSTVCKVSCNLKCKVFRYQHSCNIAEESN
jgi:hypothetical protein